MDTITPTLVPTIDPVSLSPHNRLLQLCHDLQAAGIWLYVQDTGALIAGPPELVHRSPALLHRLREQKPALLRLLEDCLAVEMFGTEAADPRFARETCPDCQRLCYVISVAERLIQEPSSASSLTRPPRHHAILCAQGGAPWRALSYGLVMVRRCARPLSWVRSPISRRPAKS